MYIQRQTVKQVAFGLRRFVKKTVLKTEGQKYQTKLQTLKKWINVNTGCNVKRLHSQREFKSYPHLPAKPIGDEVDYITKMRSAMSSKRSTDI
jgi:hypothetical protein